LVVEADYGGQRSIRGFRLKVGQGMAWQVVARKQALRVTNYSKCEWQAPDLDAQQFKAVIEVPLEVKNAERGDDEIIGVLYVTDVEEGREFTDRDERLLRLLAGQAAIAIKNAEAFDTNRKNLSKISLLYDLSMRLNSATSLRDILEVTLEEALKAVRTDEGSIMVLDAKNEEMEITSWMVEGKHVPVTPDRKLRVGEGIAGKVAAEKEPYLWSVNDQKARFVPTFTGRDLQSILCVPIISQGRLGRGGRPPIPGGQCSGLPPRTRPRDWRAGLP
jgi:GAF domain-containing protein